MHSSVTITPQININHSAYYDIYYKTSYEGEISNAIGPHSVNLTEVSNNSQLHFYSIVETDFTIYFEVKNRETGEICITKSYDIHLSMNAGSLNSGENNGSITGGVINGGTDDEEKITPDNDNNFLGYEDLDETSSLNDIVTVAKGSFETFKVAFSILPKFIWAFVFITLGCIVALRILGR